MTFSRVFAAPICACIASVFALPAFAQTASPAPALAPAAQKLPAYEVVTIKPHQAGLDNGMSASSTADGFSASGMTFPVLLQNAFSLKTRDQIVGLPSWATSDSFDIAAKMDAETAASLQKLPKEERRRARQQMMQALLADRFGLKVHHESRELPVYNLIVAKSGIKMKISTSESSGSSMSNSNYTAQGSTVEGIAFTLSSIVGRQVIDKTGLADKYDFKLTWTPDEMRAPSDASAAATAADSAPSIFSAIEEQLGLKLVSAKGPIDVVVVDHVERPSEN
jgi:uncharacterized protein (TIGR03435 family)